MRHVVTLCALAAVLALTGVARAGGWATVGFSPLPDGTAVGETWSPEITVLQHGRTPLEGLSPVVTIRKDASEDERSYTATETAEAGVYRADVVFPSGGEWRVIVKSGFWGEGSTVTYGPVTIEPVPPAAAPRAFPALPLVAVALLLGLAGLAALAIRRTRRLTPAGH
jgi:hypothetical protein